MTISLETAVKNLSQAQEYGALTSTHHSLSDAHQHPELHSLVHGLLLESEEINQDFDAYRATTFELANRTSGNAQEILHLYTQHLKSLGIGGEDAQAELINKLLVSLCDDLETLENNV